MFNTTNKSMDQQWATSFVNIMRYSIHGMSSDNWRMYSNIEPPPIELGKRALAILENHFFMEKNIVKKLTKSMRVKHSSKIDTSLKLFALKGPTALVNFLRAYDSPATMTNLRIAREFFYRAYSLTLTDASKDDFPRSNTVMAPGIRGDLPSILYGGHPICRFFSNAIRPLELEDGSIKLAGTVISLRSTKTRFGPTGVINVTFKDGECLYIRPPGVKVRRVNLTFTGSGVHVHASDQSSIQEAESIHLDAIILNAGMYFDFTGTMIEIPMTEDHIRSITESPSNTLQYSEIERKHSPQTSSTVSLTNNVSGSPNITNGRVLFPIQVETYSRSWKVTRLYGNNVEAMIKILGIRPPYLSSRHLRDTPVQLDNNGVHYYQLMRSNVLLYPACGLLSRIIFNDESWSPGVIALQIIMYQEHFVKEMRRRVLSFTTEANIK